jgi:hypothetical protein
MNFYFVNFCDFFKLPLNDCFQIKYVLSYFQIEKSFICESLLKNFLDRNYSIWIKIFPEVLLLLEELQIFGPTSRYLF